MITNFLQRSLIALKERSVNIDKLYRLKVNLKDFDEGITDKLEESIAIILSKGNEKNFEAILADISWWIYDEIDKIITLKNGEKLDLNEVGNFVSWLENNYD